MAKVIVSDEALEQVLQKVLELGEAVVPEDSHLEYLGYIHSYGVTVDIRQNPHQIGETVTFVLDLENSSL